MTTLLPTWTLGDLELTSYPFAVEFGGDHGAPESVSELVTSMLADGDLVRQTRHGNRQVSIVVVVEGATLGILAENEAVLRSECSKLRNTLSFQPGDIDSPTSVFEVLMVEMRQPRDDMHESHLVRRWELTLTCGPFARSVDLTTVPALLPPSTTPSTPVVDAVASTTGWAAESDDLFFFDATYGAVRTTVTGARGAYLTLGRTAPVDMTGYPYLMVEWQIRYTYGPPPTVNLFTTSGTPLLEVARIALDLGGSLPNWYRSWYSVEPGQLAGGFYMNAVTVASGVPTLAISNVSKSNIKPGTSKRQLSRIIDVGGTERTPASLHAFSDTGFLGTTILHTTPHDGSGYSPDMRRWRVSGNTSAVNGDARKITGLWEALRPNPVVSRTPAHSLPRGGYVLMAAMKSDTVATVPIDWAVKSVTSGVTVGSIEGTRSWPFGVAHEMTIVPIAADLSLPVVRSGVLDIEVHLFNPNTTVALSVEEWWLFKVDDDSALSIVNTFEGNLWLDSPDVDSPVPRVWVGPDKASGFHPSGGLIAQGTHNFPAGKTLVTSVSDSNDYLEVELTYHKRWHSNAAE